MNKEREKNLKILLDDAQVEYGMKCEEKKSNERSFIAIWYFFNYANFSMVINFHRKKKYFNSFGTYKLNKWEIKKKKKNSLDGMWWKEKFLILHPIITIKIMWKFFLTRWMW